MRISSSLSVYFLLLVFLMASFTQAHPFHTTTAEMEFNPNSGRFEVSLKIPATDFEYMVHAGAALKKAQESKNHDARSTRGTQQLSEQLAATYLEKQFVVTVAGESCHLEWIGSEDDLASKWLYFELVLPSETKRSGDMTLTNKVLCDRNSGQINTVVVITKTARVSLKTHELSTVVSLPRIE